MTIAPGTIVKVQWRDAVTKHGWITPQEAKDWEPCVMHTVGFLVAHTPDHLTVMQTFNDQQVTGVFTIPAGWVLSVTPLEAP